MKNMSFVFSLKYPMIWYLHMIYACKKKDSGGKFLSLTSSIKIGLIADYPEPLFE